MSRRDRAVERLQDGDVTFTRAAELAGTSVYEFADLIADCDVSWVSELHLEVDLDALSNDE